MSQLNKRFMQDNAVDSAKIQNGQVNAEDLFSTNAAGGIPLLDSSTKIVSTQISKAGGTTNNTEFEADGTVKFNGTATVWDDLRIPLYARTGGTAPTFTSGFAGNAGLFTWNFLSNATNNMYFEVQMPHGWAGTTIYPHVHWSPTTTGTGSVRWIFEYTWVNIDGTFGASSTYNVDETISTASQWKHIITGGSGITPSSSQNGISSQIIGRLYRVGGGTNDTYAAAAALLAIDIHYEIDTVGSRQMTVK